MTDYLTDAQNDVKAYFESHDIPKHFYQCFFGELIKIFGGNLIIPNPEYMIDYDDDGNIIHSETGDYSYRDQLDYSLTCLGGTGGWYTAFREACAQCELTELYQYYQSIDWVRSDIFDGYIADQTLDIVFADNKSEYYFFKRKGK